MPHRQLTGREDSYAEKSSGYENKEPKKTEHALTTNRQSDISRK